MDKRPSSLWGLIPPGSSVLCAVSGGADSVYLLHLLSQRQDITLTAAHFNHQLRGEESDADEDFVRSLCQAWGVPLTVGRGDARAFSKREGLSLEEGARTLRYAFLETAAEQEGCGLIATAHTADDNAETLLLNLVRGTGLAGLTGIPPKRGNIVRPLLDMTHRDILAYLEERRLPHREDSSNRDEAYARNKLRARVMPVLREVNPRAAEHMARSAAQLSEIDRYLDDSAQSFLSQVREGPGTVSLPWEALAQAPQVLRPRIAFRLLDRLGAGRKDVRAVHVEALLSLSPGASLSLPHGVTARRQGDRLIFERREGPPPEAPLLPGKPLAWGAYTLLLLDEPQGKGLSLSVPEGASLTVGPCPLSQRLRLPGAPGARTVKRLCMDQRVPPQEREGLPAIFVDRRLAAVWPIGTDQAFLPEGAPRRAIQITNR